jgi:hypothetical protein
VHRDGASRSDRFVWTAGENDVVLVYGSVGDDPGTFRNDRVPLFDRPQVTLTESPKASDLRPGFGSHVPPAGAVFLAARGATGIVRVDGLQVTIDAADERAVLAAARALRQMRGRSGTGAASGFCQRLPKLVVPGRAQP